MHPAYRRSRRWSGTSSGAGAEYPFFTPRRWTGQRVPAPRNCPGNLRSAQGEQCQPAKEEQKTAQAGTGPPDNCKACCKNVNHILNSPPWFCCEVPDEPGPRVLSHSRDRIILELLFNPLPGGYLTTGIVEINPRKFSPLFCIRKQQVTLSTTATLQVPDTSATAKRDVYSPGAS